MMIDWGNLATTAGIMAALGFVTGWLFKMFIKIALAFVGLYVGSLYWLAHKGVITINEQALMKMVTGTTHAIMTTADKLVAAIPTGGAFAAGFFAALAKS